MIISKNFGKNVLFLKMFKNVLLSEADSGLVKLVMMTNIFFNNQEHKIKIKRFVCVKRIKACFFSVTAEVNVLFIVYVKRENRPIQKSKFPVKFSSLTS